MPQLMNIMVLGSSDPVSAAVAWSLDTRIADVTEPIAGRPDGVVVIVGMAPAPEPVESHTLDEGGWRRLTEEPMRRTLGALQLAHSSMIDRGGRIVVVLPSIGLSGSARLVPYTTALEGIRAMVKSAARQWAPVGISLNMVAAPLPLFIPEAEPLEDHLTAPAVQDDGLMIETVLEAVMFLLRRDIRHLAGTTIVADGGSVMLP